VAGGAGDDLLGDVTRAGADAYPTADLRHHPASEHAEAGGPALLDLPHWSSKHPWLYDTAARLRAALNDTVDTVVSEIVTDPWSMQVPFAKEPSIAS
jgi:putative NIF3 family GTP cyclohydrolase 1 type 2